MKPAIGTDESTTEVLDWDDVIDTIQCFEIKNEPDANENPAQGKLEEPLAITANVVDQAGQPREDIHLQRQRKGSYTVEMASKIKPESPRKVSKNKTAKRRNVKLNRAIDNDETLPRKSVRNGHLANKKQTCKSLQVAGVSVDRGRSSNQSFSSESNSMVVIDYIFVQKRQIKDPLKDICRPSYVKLYDIFKNPQEMRRAVQGEIVCYDVKQEEQDEEKKINVLPMITVHMPANVKVTQNNLQTRMCKTPVTLHHNYNNASENSTRDDSHNSMMDKNFINFQCCPMEAVTNDSGKVESPKFPKKSNTQDMIYATSLRSKKCGEENKIKNTNIINGQIDSTFSEKSDNTAVCIDLDDKKNQNCWIWNHRGPDHPPHMSLPLQLCCDAGDNNMAIPSNEVLQECKGRNSGETQFQQFSSPQNVFLTMVPTAKIISSEDRSAGNSQDNMPVKEKAKSRHCIRASIGSMKHSSLHCHICDKRFKHKYILKRHLNKVHKSTKPGSYSCDKCGLEYSRKFNLQRHQNKSCCEYKCLLCSKTFISKYNLSKHEKYWCNEIRKIKNAFKCEQCDKIFSCNRTLKAHRRHHHRGFVYKCETCSRKYVSEKYYKEHLAKGHQTSEAVCQMCGLVFISAKRKNVHNQKEHKEREKVVCMDLDKERNHNSCVWDNRDPDLAPQISLPIQMCCNTVDDKMTIPSNEVLQECKDRNSGETQLQTLLNPQYTAVYLNTVPTAKIISSEDRSAGNSQDNMPVKEKARIRDCICASTGFMKHASRHCHICDRRFKYKYMLTRHLKEVHKLTKPGSYCCDKCGLVYTKKSNLQSHQKRGCCEYKCLLCSKTFISKFNLSKHEESWCNEIRKIRNPFKCEKCDKTFNTNTALKRHRRHHHRSFIYKCETCSRKYVSEKYYEEHLAKGHQTSEAVCEICGLVFISAKRKNDHKHKKHFKKSTNFLCSFCGKSFQAKTKFEQHVNTHAGIYRYHCSKCDKGFINSVRLKNHMQCVHSNIKTYICELCGKLFKTSVHLNQHRSIHLGIKRYSCKHCSASFRIKEALNVHYRSHTGETPFSCKECGKKFKTSSQIKTHVKIHSDVREHKCPACQEEFKLPHHLRAHIARKHTTAP